MRYSNIEPDHETSVALPPTVEAEGDAGAHDIVDPGLELGGQAEIVHRRADHDQVGPQKLLHQDIALGELRPRRLVPPLGSGEGRRDPVGVDGRGRLLPDIAIGQAVLRPRRPPALDEAVRQAARVRSSRVDPGKTGAGAGVDLEDVEGLHNDLHDTE